MFPPGTWPRSAFVVPISYLIHLENSESVLSKTAIFPQKEGRKREISCESARGSSLREAKF